MIVLFTDFGLSGPYTGQMKAILAQTVPQESVIDLFSDLPVHSVKPSAHLLAAYSREFPADSVFLCVVDPGVGTALREPVILHADGLWFVGPGNGLFDVVAARSARVEAWRILWKPKRLSASFHGRDLFAPVAAMIAGGAFPEAERIDYTQVEAAGDDYAGIIYIDHFGNLVTGIRSAFIAANASLRYKESEIRRVKTFGEVGRGEPLCYENSSGLLEIAINCGRAESFFDAEVGDEVVVLP